MELVAAYLLRFHDAKELLLLYSSSVTFWNPIMTESFIRLENFKHLGLRDHPGQNSNIVEGLFADSGRQDGGGIIPLLPDCIIQHQFLWLLGWTWIVVFYESQRSPGLWVGSYLLWPCIVGQSGGLGTPREVTGQLYRELTTHTSREPASQDIGLLQL